MSLSKPDREAILKAALEKTKEEFATEISSRTTLTQKEVLGLAKSKAEREALANVLAAVTSTAGSNAAKARAIRDISGGVEALVKIVRLVV